MLKTLIGISLQVQCLLLFNGIVSSYMWLFEGLIKLKQGFPKAEEGLLFLCKLFLLVYRGGLIFKSTGLQLWPNFMALLTKSKETTLMEAGNSALTSSVFHGLAGNFGVCACVLHITKHAMLTRLAQQCGDQP